MARKAHSHRLGKLCVALVGVACLAACGGGSDAPAASAAPAASSILTISAANPSSHNGTVDFAASSTNLVARNAAQTANAAIAVDYCDISFLATASTGNRYEIKVYFRRSDAQVLNASVFQSATTPWVVGEFNTGSPISAGVSVNVAARSISFNSKALTGTSGETATLSGTVSFPANATGVAACGV